MYICNQCDCFAFNQATAKYDFLKFGILWIYNFTHFLY